MTNEEKQKDIKAMHIMLKIAIGQAIRYYAYMLCVESLNKFEMIENIFNTEK